MSGGKIDLSDGQDSLLHRLVEVARAIHAGDPTQALGAALEWVLKLDGLHRALVYTVDVVTGVARLRARAGSPGDVPELVNLTALEGATSPSVVRALATRMAIELTPRDEHGQPTGLAVPILGARADDVRGVLVAELNQDAPLDPFLRQALEVTAGMLAPALTHGSELSGADFLSTISHELRTPLQAILGWAQMLAKSPTPDALSRGLEVIERNARLEASLVDALLDGSRLARGVLRLHPASVRMHNVLESAVAAVRPSAASKRVDITVDDMDPCEVLGDSTRLVQVFHQLLVNAVKFTPSGGTVQVSLAPDDAHAIVRVTDTGAGLSTDDLASIFELFWQSEGTVTRSHTGLGLGLAMARHILDMHGGTVKAESEGAGRGTTFVVELPLLGTTRVPLERRGRLLEGLRVLLVEDDQDAREMVALALRSFGAEVVSAATASEALVFSELGPPDVVVSDLRLPDEDGYSLLPKLRSHSIAPAPALALTALASQHDRERALAAGFQAHLAKPVAAAELARAVAALSGRLH